MCLQFGFLNFWRKDFGAKAAHKMLVKLTPSDSYERTGRVVVDDLVARVVQSG